MAGKQDFTEEEREQLRKGVSGAALLVSVSDPGFFETFKEAGAAARHLAEARRGKPASSFASSPKPPPGASGWA